MTPAMWLLILFGPVLLIGPQALVAGLSFPGLWSPRPSPQPRPVARPRVRLAVAL